MSASAITADQHQSAAQASQSAPANPKRALRMPTRREFNIFRLSEILGLTHAEIALNSETVTRRRISQIVAKVRRWLSLHPCEDPRLATELQRKRLAQHLERMRLEDVIKLAHDELIYGKKELTTTTEKDDGTKTVTTRQQPFNVQALKTYLRATQTLGKLHQRPEVPTPPPEEGAFPWIVAAIDDVWNKWLTKISSGKLRPEGIEQFIDELQAALLKAASVQKELKSTQGASEGSGLRGQGSEAPPCSASEDGTQARSASEGPGCMDGCDSDSTAPPNTEYSVPGALDRSEAPAGAPSSFIPPPSSLKPTASLASHTSLAEAAARPMEAVNGGDATHAGHDTCAAPATALTDPPHVPSDHKNEKREAPPITAPCSPLPLSPCPSSPVP